MAVLCWHLSPCSCNPSALIRGHRALSSILLLLLLLPSLKQDPAAFITSCFRRWLRLAICVVLIFDWPRHLICTDCCVNVISKFSLTVQGDHVRVGSFRAILARLDLSVAVPRCLLAVEHCLV